MEHYPGRYGILRPGRFIAVQIPVPKLVDLLKKTEEGGGFRIIENGLPEDARIVRTHMEWIGPVNVLFVVAESDSLPMLGMADPIPLLSPSVRSARKSGEKGSKRGKTESREVVIDASYTDRPPFGPGSDEDPETFPPVDKDEPELPI